MFDIRKMTQVTAGAGSVDMDAVNAYSRRPLTEDEVYLFSVRACDDQPDRDFEKFTPECLGELLPLFIGKSILSDHDWSTNKQCARIYGGEVVADEAETWLRLDCYMPRTDATARRIEMIDTGVVKEISVGCACKKLTCSICGRPLGSCEHRKGQSYDGEICLGLISEAADAYEVSFVAVPAQQAAGVLKAAEPAGSMTPDAMLQARDRLRIERLRY